MTIPYRSSRARMWCGLVYRSLPYVILVGVFASPGIMAQELGIRGKVYVANQGSDTVSVIDAATLAVVATVGVEDYPHNVNHTPDGRYVLATNKNINIDTPASLSIIDTATDSVVATVENLGDRIEHVVAVSNDVVCVTEDLGKNAVLFIDLPSRSVAAEVAVGVKPHGLWPTSDSAFLFVPNQLSGSVSKIDVKGRKVVAESNVGLTPTMVVVSPDDSTVYATLFGERGVAVIDAQLVESGRMQVNDIVRVGERPAQVGVTPDGRFVLVPCEGPGALYVIDAKTHEIVASIPTGTKAHGVDVSTDGSYAFVTNLADGTVSVVDLERLVVIKEIAVGELPAGIDFVSVSR